VASRYAYRVVFTHRNGVEAIDVWRRGPLHEGQLITAKGKTWRVSRLVETPERGSAYTGLANCEEIDSD
jgi:hypothetical protein